MSKKNRIKNLTNKRILSTKVAPKNASQSRRTGNYFFLLLFIKSNACVCAFMENCILNFQLI